MVQFATCMYSNRRYAVKFFLDRNAFNAEAALYGAFSPALCAAPDIAVAAYHVRSMHEARHDAPIATGPRFLPDVVAVLDGARGELLDARGNSLPPCIVMERGESLQEWAERTEPDLCKVLAVRTSGHRRLSYTDIYLVCTLYNRAVSPHSDTFGRRPRACQCASRSLQPAGIVHLE